MVSRGYASLTERELAAAGDDLVRQHLAALDLHETPLVKMLPQRRRLCIYRARHLAPRAVRGFHAFGYRPRTRKVEWSDGRLAP